MTLVEWNYDLLPVELKDLASMNFDLSLLGFSDTDLTEILAPPGNEGLTDPDAVPEPPDEAVTQPGDLWILGNHRLLCGDAGEAADVDRLLAGALNRKRPHQGLDYQTPQAVYLGLAKAERTVLCLQG